MKKQFDVASIINEQMFNCFPEFDILVVNNSSLVNAIKVLAKNINKKCKEGWEIEGNVIVSPIRSFEYSVAHAIKKRHDTAEVLQYDIIVESGTSVSKALKELSKDINDRYEEGWKREGNIVISPIMETTNRIVVYQVVTK